MMKQTRILMGMPVTLEVVDSPDAGEGAAEELFGEVFDYFEYIDEKFSTYKDFSEISLVNQGALALEETSYDMRTVFDLAEQFRLATGGYFDIRRGGGGKRLDDAARRGGGGLPLTERNSTEHSSTERSSAAAGHGGQQPGPYDPSGLVKGWAIFNAAEIVRQKGFENFYVEAGGDFEVCGKNSQGQDWRVGIRSPFDLTEIVKVLAISDRGVATSGTYIRGQHIYNPNGPATDPEIVSLTVIGPDIFTADCYATAAFAMGREGIGLIERLDGFEGYMIDTSRLATYTSSFERYVLP